MARIEADFEDACDFHLIGVSSHVGPHRLGWDLNWALGWDLMHFLDWEIAQPEGASSHPIYRHRETHDGPAVYLICNRTPQGAFAPGAAQLDYLVSLPCDSFEPESAARTLRTLTSVSVAAVLNPFLTGALEALAVLDLTETESAQQRTNAR